MTDDIETALVPITVAQRMLAEAVTFEDFRNLRDVAATAKAYVRARGLGIDAENTAAEYILRAERGMGRVLAQMRVDGTRQRQGDTMARNWMARGLPAESGRPPLPTLSDLGIANKKQAGEWQKLAVLWDDDTFEEKLAYVKGLGARLSKVDFYRGPKAAAKRDASVVREAQEGNEPTTPLRTFLRAARSLIVSMPLLPNDDLAQVGTCLRELVDAYGVIRRERS